MDDGIPGRARVRRHPERGAADWQVINRILDEGLIGHVGFVTQGQPYVIPMAYGRLASSTHVQEFVRLLGEHARQHDAPRVVNLRGVRSERRASGSEG